MKKELKTQLLLQIFTLVVSQTFCLLGNKVLALEEVYKLPFPEGEGYIITQGYDNPFSHKKWPSGADHRYSIDFGVMTGTKIAATKSGKVVKLVQSHESPTKNGCFDPGPAFCSKINNYVILQHDENVYSVYSHLKKDGVLVKLGQEVKQGQLIAESGNSGYSTRPHLHFAIIESPYPYANTIKVIIDELGEKGPNRYVGKIPPIISTNKFFDYEKAEIDIKKAYEEIVNREPDENELKNKIDKLKDGESLTDIRKEIASTDESQDKINQLIQDILHKRSENIDYWIDKLTNGETLGDIKIELEQHEENVVKENKKVIAKHNEGDNKIGLNVYTEANRNEFAAGKEFGLTWGSIGEVVESETVDGEQWWKVNWGGDLTGWSLEKNLSAKPLFPDVSLDNTFAEQIYKLLGNNIVNGFDDGTFKPDKELSRGALSKFIYNALGFEEHICDSFPDVDSNNPFYKEINTLKCKGIIGGFEDRTFRSESLVNRGEMAKFIKNSFKFETDMSCSEFTDVDSENDFYGHITTLKCKEIVNGFDDGTYKPENSVTRGETAKFIINSIEKQMGQIQELPLLPNSTDEYSFFFVEVPSGLWYDPPTNYGFEFEMLEDSLFTDIVNFPVGIDSDNIFTVFANGQSLGEYSPGESVNFAALLGEGVSKFTIGDIDSINPEDPTAFPIQLKFNTDVASFKMTSIVENKKIPEPSGIIGLVVIGIYGIFHKNKK